MAKEWEGRTFDEDWFEIDAMGNRLTGQKDWQANAGSAAVTPGALNPYTNQPGTSQWDNSGLIPGNEPGSTLQPVGAGGANAGGGTQTATATGTAPNTTNTNWKGLDTAVTDTLMRDINLDGTVDMNDPAFKEQMDANALQTNLAADRSRAAMAQRRAATGTGSSGAVDTDANKVLEQQAYQDKAFQGSLMDKFRQQNIDKMQTALTLGSGMLTAQQERDLRAALTREGYTTQKDISAEQIKLGRDQLGANTAISQAQLEAQIMLGLLGNGG